MDTEVNSNEHLNILGLFSAPEDVHEIANILAQMKSKWPYNDHGSCHDLFTLIHTIDLDITGHMEKKANNDSKSNQRVQNRYISAGTQYKNELQALYLQRQCAKMEEEAETQAYFDNQYNQLERVKGLTSSTSKYLIYGMLGLVVIVSGLIILRSDKK